MAISHAESASLTCPRCKRSFTAEIWLIVDIAERPDLAGRCREGTIHTLTCPHCGNEGQVDAPLLLYLTPTPSPTGKGEGARGRGEVPRLLFSPAQQTTVEEDREQAAGLLALLRDRLGDEWRDKWVEQMQVVPRQMLPLALSEDPEAYRRLEEAAQEAMEQILTADPLVAGVQALLKASSMAALLQVAHDHPALLAPEAGTRVQQMVQAARDGGEAEMVRELEERYRLLREIHRAAQESGLTLEQAIEMTTQVEGMVRDKPDVARLQALARTLQQFIEAETWDESRRIVEEHPELLSDEADELLGQMVDAAQAQGDENARRVFEQHRALLRRCRGVGVERAFAEKVLPPEVLEQAAALGLTPEQVLEMARLAAEMPPELRDVLAELAASGVEIRSPEDLERLLAGRPDLREKLERALGAAASAGVGPMPAGIGPILRELSRPAQRSDMPRRIELCQQALRLVDRRENPELWAALQVELASSLAQNPLGGRAENIEQAIHHYTLALEVYTRRAYPADWAMIQGNLGNIYANRIRGEQAENMEQAIRYYTQALEVYTRRAFPADWARTQTNLGNVYWSRICGERAENIEQAIHCHTQALKVYTRQAYPELWAATQSNLANAYQSRIRGERAENIEQAIHHYTLALEVYTRQADPERWAAIQSNLGAAYESRIHGDRAENIEKAIGHYFQALEVRTRQADPEHWAETQNNLGIAYFNRIRGKRAENTEQAIHCHTQALEVYTRQAFPTDWAMTQNNLGNAYWSRIRGERAENVEQAIYHYTQALEVRTRQAYPEDWAMTQNNLGNAYAERIYGERAENIEQAIHHYTLALEVYTRQAYPAEWAMTQSNLGNVYANRIRGERAKNIEQTIHHCTLALEVYTRQADPESWAAIQNNLGLAYAGRIRGERAKNIEQAIHHYTLALKVRTRQADPERWAATQNNLAIAYWNRIRGDRAENIEQAIQCYTQALEVRTRQADPEHWAETQNNLGSAYRSRIRGERAENIERAIHCHTQALEVYTRQANPERWAWTQSSLGNAYQGRIRGDRAKNIEQAICHYIFALKVYRRQAFPVEWAMAQSNLGSAYRKRIHGNEAKNIERAIYHHTLALEVRTRQAYPGQWATTQNNLGNAYRDRIRGKRAENLEQAIRHYEQALEVYTRQAYPADWAMTQSNLGLAYAERIRGERAKNIKLAIHHYTQALEVYTAETWPDRARTTARNLARLHFDNGHWAQAHNSLEIAIRAAETLYRASHSPAAKEAELAENTELYELMVRVCLNEPDRAAALVHAEGGKARAFLDQMGQAAFPPPLGLPAHLVQGEEALIRELREQEQELVALSGRTDEARRHEESSRESKVVERRRQTLAALEAVWDEMARDYPVARSYVAMRRGEPVTWDDLCALAGRLGPEAALVEFYTLPDEIAVFVLRADWEAPQVYRAPLSQDVLLYRYLLPYQDEVLNRDRFVRSGRTPTHAWLSLGEPLLAPLETHLGDAALVYFIPQGWLHYLPLHALTVAGEPFIARHTVAYAPSAAVLARALETAPAPEPIAGDGSSALVMGYTPNEDPVERAFFEGEAVAIAKHLHAGPLLDMAADADALRRRGPAARVIHLSCHGYFNPRDPAASSVLLSSGEFTLHDWMALSLSADLVTLSACETGLSDVKRGDDLTGLTRALLYAGASSALVTLWSVRADTTLEWMLDFYNRAWDARGNKRTTEALAFQQATLALRERHHDPYYWAPFTLVGDWR